MPANAFADIHKTLTKLMDLLKDVRSKGNHSVYSRYINMPAADKPPALFD